MNLPTKTIRDLALVVVLIADAAWDGVKEALERLRPYIDPSPDMSVRSSVGALYTGVILIDKNEVIAGIVIRVGQQAAPATPPPRYERPPSLSSSPWRSSSPLADRLGDEEDDDGKLPSWADDARDRSEPWRR